MVILIEKSKKERKLDNQKLSDDSVNVNFGASERFRVILATPRWPTLAVLSEEMRWRLYALVRAAHRPVSREEAGRQHRDLPQAGRLSPRQAGQRGPAARPYDAPLGPRRVGRTPKTYEPSGTDIAISIPARHYDVLAGILMDAVRAGASGEDPSRPRRRPPGSRVPSMGPVSGAAAPGPPRRRARADRGRGDPRRASGTSRSGGPTELRLRNCPFHPLSGPRPDVVCKVNQAYPERTAGRPGATSAKAVPDPDPGTCCVRLTGTPR